MSIKAYKYRIYANKGTTEKLHWVLDRCRELYNAGLQERRDTYEIQVRQHPGYYDEETLKRRLPSLWTNSYFVATVGGVTLETLKRYVEGQKNR